MNGRLKTLAVVGLGYVGLPLAILADKKGYAVTGIDNDEEKVEKLRKRIIPFKDGRLVEELVGSMLDVTTDFSKISQVETIVICVPTPVHDNHIPNLEPVINASKEIALHMRKGQLVILESTVNPGVSEGVVMPLLEQGSGLECGVDFHMAHCPERINPGDERWSVDNIPRVVGGSDKAGLEKAVTFYKSIVAAPVRAMGSLKEAEAVKVVENAFRDVNIAFVNELAISFSRLGIDVVNVIDGAATKPFSFLPHFPGCGVGGHCIPVDPYYLIEYARTNGFQHSFLALARSINNRMPNFTAGLVMEELNKRRISMSAAKVAVLGVAYKPDIDDYRESPSFPLIKYLKGYGSDVSVYDPYVPQYSTASSLEEAIKGADAVVIATAHSQFRSLEPEFFLNNGVEVLVDGRNCLEKDKFISAGLKYRGIGR